ncbi:urease accessory protein UreF [Pontivivens insulae]|uniref:Urease accessory protein UreF n=1 Tax=Pontivivens insulae TaxID=1639689 RepID=A0A2R8AAZ9_9RHOB|nr:urease accessory UreF family protein [Pontivivens insulae]RED13319.1 urease accessory protein [Pontivivens insulae]SPF29411.1 Urease accessory protein UreF [Pontivivens insulae]
MRDAQLLHQWLSPGFPTGAFAWSHGLDRLISDDVIYDAAGLQAWLEDVLRHGAGRADAILLSHAYHADDVSEIAELAAALAPSRERYAETMDQGASFMRVTGALFGGRTDPLPYPVAVGYGAAREGIALDMTVVLYLQAFVANLVSAAVRAIPLGQTDGQRIVMALLPLCETVAQDAQDAGLDKIGTASIRADMASLQHETQYSRMFRS